MNNNTNTNTDNTAYIEPVGFNGTNGEWKLAMSGGQVWADNEKTVCTLETIPLKISKKIFANAAIISQSKEMAKAIEPFVRLANELTETKVKQGGILFQYNDAKITVEDFLNAKQVLQNAGLTV